jgi:hypothetical protein
MEVTVAAETWLDLLNFSFEWLAKVRATAKKCIELCGEYVEYIPSVVTVACFFPGWVKDLSASPCIIRWIFRKWDVGL